MTEINNMNDTISKQAVMDWMYKNYGSYSLTGNKEGELYKLLATDKFDCKPEEISSLLTTIESQKEEKENLLNWINQKMNNMTNLNAYSYQVGIYHGYKAVKEHIELGAEIAKLSHE